MLSNTLISLALGCVLGCAGSTDGEFTRLTTGGGLDGVQRAPEATRTPSNAWSPSMVARRNQGAFRRAVLQASTGRCAVCDLDVKTLMFEVAELWGDVQEGKADPSVYLDTLQVYGVDSPKLGHPPALWEADHVIPLHLGGADDPISNGQFLCLGCHRAKTTLENLHRFCDHPAADGDVCTICGVDANVAFAVSA